MANTQHLDQGEGGARRTKARGDHLDPTGEGGAKQGPGPSTSAKAGLSQPTLKARQTFRALI